MTTPVKCTENGEETRECSVCHEKETRPIEAPGHTWGEWKVTTPATYYLKNGKHYIVYDEVVEGIPGTIKNRIKIDEGKLLDITKSGITNSHMVFETDKINVTPYQTPYGDLLLGTYTKGMDIQIEEERIELQVRYSLDINGDKAADCDIRILIEANE